LPTNWGSRAGRSPGREGWAEPTFGASQDSQAGSTKPRLGSVTGTWWNEELQFQISRAPNGDLLLEIENSKIRGTLIPDGDWFESSVIGDDGKEVFCLRIKMEECNIVSRVKFPGEAWADFLVFSKVAGSSVPAESPPAAKKPSSRAPSPVANSLGRMLSGLEPLLEQLLREEDAPQEKGGSVGGGGPEATPEKAGQLPADMRGAVVTTLCQMAKTVRELGGNVENLKDENKTLRKECQQLRVESDSETPSAATSAPSAASVQEPSAATAERPPSNARDPLSTGAEASDWAERGIGADEQPAGTRRGRAWPVPAAEPAPAATAPVWPCPAGWTVPSASGSSGANEARKSLSRRGKSSSREGSVAAAPEQKEALRRAPSNTSELTTSARMAALNDDLGKALLKLQRSPSEQRDE